MPCRLCFSVLFVLVFLFVGESWSARVKDKSAQEGKELKNVHWICHAAVKITNGKIIYVDPFRIGKKKKDADIVLITHSHFDHYSPKDIEKVRKKKTIFVVPDDTKCILELKDLGEIKIMKPGATVVVDGVEITAVPAYNIEKKFHPKAKNWLGYIVKVGDVRYYFAGDTDFIPEMKEIEADVAFLPVGGTYTMDIEEAAEAAKVIKAKYFVPYHCEGVVVGKKGDTKRFKKLCDKAVILKMERGK